MIVVDPNVLAASLLWGTAETKRLLALDADWVVPPIWLPEFRNILVKCVRHGRISLADASTALVGAWKRIIPADREIPSEQIIELAAATQCSAYDCEYVVLAKMLHLKFVTGDEGSTRERILSGYLSLAGVHIPWPEAGCFANVPVDPLHWGMQNEHSVSSHLPLCANIS